MKRFFIHYIGILGIMLGILGMAPFIAHAANAPVTGWAWSYMPNGSNQAVTPGNNSGGQGLGWISLNNTNGNGGNVSFDPTTGKFSGYGWTPYGGWLDFDPSGPYPAGPSHGVQVDLNCWTNGLNNGVCPVTGWARFIAGTGNNNQAGGWDGWVKMSGPEWSNGVVVNKYQETMTGNAWGDDVAGWVGFDAKIELDEILGCMNPNDTNYDPNATINDQSMCAGDINKDSCKDNTGAMIPHGKGDPLPYTCQTATCSYEVKPDPRLPSVTKTITYYLADYPSGGLPKECEVPQKVCQGVGDYAGKSYTYTNNPPCQCTTGICTGGPGGSIIPGYKEN